MKKRVYVCHTYYQIYVTLLKEFHRNPDELGQADILLSNLSTDFEDIGKRLVDLGLFQSAEVLEEYRYHHFPELAVHREDKGSIILNLFHRMIYTKKYPKCLAPYLSRVDWKAYEDIYVYCDSDPIGFYLNYKHIPYHALEDGLDCLKYLDAARYDNRGHFKLKAFLSSLNLIFIQNGYGKYCIDMEINDRSCLKYDCPKYIEVPRKPLEEALTCSQKDLMLKAFVPDYKELLEQIHAVDTKKGFVLLLTQALCPLDVRERLFRDIIREYADGYHVIIKPHPRDELEYDKTFKECTTIKGRFPVEVLNFIEGVHFAKVISVFTTAIDTIDFADEKINLGADFLDKYEAPEKHHFNDKI